MYLDLLAAPDFCDGGFFAKVALTAVTRFNLGERPIGQISPRAKTLQLHRACPANISGESVH